VLIMTSNLGSAALQEGMSGKDTLDEDTRESVMDALRGHFRPEFLNRVDEVVIFEPLKRQDIAHIVEVQLTRIQKLLTEKRLTLELSPRARDFLAERGYDPTYGARPLKRALQKHLMDPLALKVLSGDFVPGDHIVVDVTGDKLSFGKVVLDTPKSPKGGATRATA